MFPERQQGPHRDWRAEVEYLDEIFHNGAAYTIGKVNGDHWLLYITSPGNHASTSSSPLIVPQPLADADAEAPATTRSGDKLITQDYTIEILMTHLSPSAREPFVTPSTSFGDAVNNPSEHAAALSSAVGISSLFPPELTILDAYSFSPCGYSSNALLKWRDSAGSDPEESGEGYYTIHVTPEEGWSYASFECNVPLPTHPSQNSNNIPDLKTLIRRVVDIFQPGRLTVTLFISSEDNNNAEEDDGESAIEAAQRAFKAALLTPGGEGGGRLYRRTDKINYEFGGYDLAFATFVRRS